MTTKLITFNLKLKTGFTLIELLVVISIIGILMAISLFGLQGARESSRDARRKSDLELIRSGLEIYKSDCNIYPVSPLESPLMGSGSPASCAVANTYISLVPSDPLDPTRLYPYSRPTTTTYILCASLENPPGSFDNTGCGSCGTDITCNYKVTNP